MPVPVAVAGDVSDAVRLEWQCARTRLGVSSPGVDDPLTDCSTYFQHSCLYVNLYSGRAMAELLRGVLVDAGAAADGSTTIRRDSVAAAQPSLFYTDTFRRSCYLDMEVGILPYPPRPLQLQTARTLPYRPGAVLCLQARLGDPDAAGKRGVTVRMAMRDGEGALLPARQVRPMPCVAVNLMWMGRRHEHAASIRFLIRQELVSAVHAAGSTKQRGERARLSAIAGQASTVQAGSAPHPADLAGDSQAGRRTSSRKRKQPAR